MRRSCALEAELFWKNISAFHALQIPFSGIASLIRIESLNLQNLPIFHVFVSHVKVTCQGDGGFLAKRRGGAMPPGEILPTGVKHARSEF